MNILITVLISLFFLIGCEPTPLINNFKIEGIGLEDSLLDYFSENEILENTTQYHKNNEFVTFDKTIQLSSNYDGIQIRYKKYDDKYIVYSVVGVIDFSKNIKKCYSKQNEIINELSELLNIKEWEGEPFEDQEGYFSMKYKMLDSGVAIQVYCSDWNTKFEEIYYDNLRVEINSKEYDYWIINIADN